MKRKMIKTINNNKGMKGLKKRERESASRISSDLHEDLRLCAGLYGVSKLAMKGQIPTGLKSDQ